MRERTCTLVVERRPEVPSRDSQMPRMDRMLHWTVVSVQTDVITPNSCGGGNRLSHKQIDQLASGGARLKMPRVIGRGRRASPGLRSCLH